MDGVVKTLVSSRDYDGGGGGGSLILLRLAERNYVNTFTQDTHLCTYINKFMLYRDSSIHVVN